MKKRKVAVLGAGFIGPLHMDALMRVPQAELALVCGLEADRLAALGERYGVRTCRDWRRAVGDPEIEVIHNCLPVGLHDEVNRAALLAGKKVYCEKPLSLTSAGAREIALLAEEKGIPVGLNHQYRMNAAVREMRAQVARGLPGRILAVTGCYLQESASREDDWSSRMENTGIARAISDIGTHWADTAVCVLGQPIAEVMADLRVHYPVRRDVSGGLHAMDTEDTGFILVRFADGTPGQVTVSKAANGHKNDLRVAVWGSEYSLEWQQEQPDRLLVGHKGSAGVETRYMSPLDCQPETGPFITAPMGHVMGWPDALRNAIQAYYDALDGKGNGGYATFRDGFDRMAFVEACVRSSEERRWVEVEKL